MKKLIPILLILVGIASGGAAGLLLRPAPEEPDTPKPQAAEEPVEIEVAPEDRTFVKINNQFVVPVVRENKVASLVVLSISLETTPDDTEILYNHEPKLRDAFIGVLFDYAFSGGFGEHFTSSPNLDRLRVALREAAQNVLPDRVLDVLITDIVRQDA